MFGQKFGRNVVAGVVSVLMVTFGSVGAVQGQREMPPPVPTPTPNPSPNPKPPTPPNPKPPQPDDKKDDKQKPKYVHRDTKSLDELAEGFQQRFKGFLNEVNSDTRLVHLSKGELQALGFRNVKDEGEVVKVCMSPYETARSRERQEQVIENGGSKAKMSDESFHRYGLAVDVTLIITRVDATGNRDAVMVKPKKDDHGMGNISNLPALNRWLKNAAKMGKKNYNINWGGNWRDFYDPAHFQDGNYKNVSEVKKAAERGEVHLWTRK